MPTLQYASFRHSKKLYVFFIKRLHLSVYVPIGFYPSPRMFTKLMKAAGSEASNISR